MRLFIVAVLAALVGCASLREAGDRDLAEQARVQTGCRVTVLERSGRLARVSACGKVYACRYVTQPGDYGPVYVGAYWDCR